MFGWPGLGTLTLNAIGNRDYAIVQATLLLLVMVFVGMLNGTGTERSASYALEQAVRWGRMPLPDLLTELIPEQSARDQIFKIVGIQRTE